MGVVVEWESLWNESRCGMGLVFTYVALSAQGFVQGARLNKEARAD